ncbi:MAG: FAD-dependent oxidoreductase [Myxococcota bacterium]
MVDVVVVGAGPLGSATARHLAQRGLQTALVGPGFGQTDVVHSSHHDQGRVCRRIDRVSTWTLLNVCSLANLEELEAQVGYPVRRPVGCLFASNMPDHAWFAAAPELEVEASIARAWPYALPGAVRFGLEGPPAGILLVPTLLKAQHEALRLAGGTRHVTTLVERTHRDGVHRLRLANGEALRTPKVVLCTGAYANAWLDEPLDVVLETETTLLIPVDEGTARSFSEVPTLLWDGQGPGWSSPYVVPPLRFADGQWVLKLGCDLDLDQRFTEVHEVDAWFRHGDSEIQRPALLDAARTVFPDRSFSGARTSRCILTRTPHAHPMIGEVAPGCFIGIGGHGWGAMASDGIGEHIAHAVISEPSPALPFEHCAVRWRNRRTP